MGSGPTDFFGIGCNLLCVNSIINSLEQIVKYILKEEILLKEYESTTAQLHNAETINGRGVECFVSEFKTHLNRVPPR